MKEQIEKDNSFLNSEVKGSALWKIVKTQENWFPNWFKNYCLVRFIDWSKRPPGVGDNDYCIIVSGQDDTMVFFYSNDFEKTIAIYNQIGDNITREQLQKWGFED